LTSSNTISRKDSGNSHDVVFSALAPTPPASDAMCSSLLTLATQAHCTTVATARTASSRAVTLLGSLLSAGPVSHDPSAMQPPFSGSGSGSSSRGCGSITNSGENPSSNQNIGSSSSSSIASSASGPYNPRVCFVLPLLGVSTVQAAEFCAAKELPQNDHILPLFDTFAQPRPLPAAVQSAQHPQSAQKVLDNVRLDTAAGARAAATGSVEAEGILSQAVCLETDLLPYLRQHFNPKVSTKVKTCIPLCRIKKMYACTRSFAWKFRHDS